MKVKAYRARYRLEVGPGDWREPGDDVPEAFLWFRMESFLHTGRIVEVWLTEAEFMATLALHDISEENRLLILERAGLADGVSRGGPHLSPFRDEPGPKPPAQVIPDPRDLKGPVPRRPERKDATPPELPDKRSNAKPPKEKLATRKRTRTTNPELAPVRELVEPDGK